MARPNVNALPAANHPINPEGILAIRNVANHGRLIMWKDQVDALLTGIRDFPCLVRRANLNLTFNQYCAYFSTVMVGNRELHGMEYDVVPPVVSFLDLAVPGVTDLPSSTFFGQPIGNQDEVRIVIRRAIDFRFWDDEGNPKDFLNRIWQAPEDGAVDPLGADDNPMRDLDPFIQDRDEAARAAIDLPGYLDAIYGCLEHHSEGRCRHAVMAAVIRAIISVCKMGSITDDKATKISESILEDNGVSIPISADETTRIFRYLGSIIRRQNLNMGEVLSALAATFDFDNYMRVHLTIMQSVGVRASAVNISLQAIRSYPRHEVWSYLDQEAGAEMLAFVDASRAVGNAPLIAYGSRIHTEAIKGTSFPSVAFAALTLLRVRGKNRTIRGYKGKFDTPLASRIVNIINAVEEAEIEEIDLEDYRGVHGFDWMNRMTDLNFIYETISST